MTSEQPPADESSDAVETPPTAKPSGEFITVPSLVVVNTGHGKGKSTAAFGVVVRGLGRGWPVAVVQYLKSGDWNVGEEKVLRSLGVDWFAAGDGFTWDSDNLDETEAKAVAGWEFTKELIERNQHRLVVLDEISYAMTWGWIDPVEVAKVVANRPEKMNLVLTGRDMAAEVIEVAHTVTEMTNVKHAFDSGIVAKKGIDY